MKYCCFGSLEMQICCVIMNVTFAKTCTKKTLSTSNPFASTHVPLTPLAASTSAHSKHPLLHEKSTKCQPVNKSSMHSQVPQTYMYYCNHPPCTALAFMEMCG